MAVIGGPDTVTGGSVLKLDVANIKSFRGDASTNLVPYPNTGFARYNNPSFSGTIVNTGQTFNGSPIYEATYIPQDQSMISRLGSTEGFGFLHNMGTLLNANTQYMASVYFKTAYPLAQTGTQGFVNTYSNISGWGYQGTSSTRIQEGEWTRLYTRYLNSITIGGLAYSTRSISNILTAIVNTTQTTQVLLTITVQSNGTFSTVTNWGTSTAGGTVTQLNELVGIRSANPTITATGGIAGLSTGTAAVVNHGLDTTSWTKLTDSNTRTKANLPLQYYVLLNIPSTGGVNVTISFRPQFEGYYTALSDSKYWKITFDTTNLQVNDVIRTYWTAPMIEQQSQNLPSRFVVGFRGTTVATGGGLADLTGNSNHGELVNGPIYNNANAGILVFDGVNDYIQTAYGNGINVVNTPITVCAFVKSDTSTGAQRMWMDVGGNGTDQRFYASITTATRADFGIQSSGWVDGVPIDTNWHHQALVMDNGVARFYDNGIQVQTKNYTSYTLPGNLRFGARSASEFQWFGKIANIQVYNRILSAAEIQQNFNASRSRFGI